MDRTKEYELNIAVASGALRGYVDIIQGIQTKSEAKMKESDWNYYTRNHAVD